MRVGGEPGLAGSIPLLREFARKGNARMRVLEKKLGDEREWRSAKGRLDRFTELDCFLEREIRNGIYDVVDLFVCHTWEKGQGKGFAGLLEGRWKIRRAVSIFRIGI